MQVIYRQDCLYGNHGKNNFFCRHDHFQFQNQKEIALPLALSGSEKNVYKKCNMAHLLAVQQLYNEQVEYI